MADTQSSQPSYGPIFDRFELSLEQWRDHLTQLSSTLPAGELSKLTRTWDHLRELFEIACLEHGFPIPSLHAVMDPLPILKEFNQDELELTLDALQNTRKTLAGMIAETKGRIGLLEEVLHSDKPQKMRKSLDKMRAIDESLQTRLLGLDAYIEQFHLAEIPGHDLLQTAEEIISKTTRIGQLSSENSSLDQQAQQMRGWLAESKKKLERMPPAPPPSPGAMQQVMLSISSKSEADKALLGLFSSHEKLRDARFYLENFLADKENDNA